MSQTKIKAQSKQTGAARKTKSPSTGQSTRARSAKSARLVVATGGGFGGLVKERRDPKTSQIVVVPVPYDGTSSWKKGADRGPAAMIDASANMELWDMPTATEVACRGIVTLKPIVHRGKPEGMCDRVEATVGAVLDGGRFPVVLGGEHSVSIGAMRAVAARTKHLSFLQIDAHGDTRDSYLGSPCNHACVMARARELGPITQVGIRAVDASEVAGMDPKRVFAAHEIVGLSDDSKWIDRVVRQQSRNVYVTIDLDAFDPSLVPATGTPEPGGLLWHQVERLLRRLCRKRNVVAFDVVELLPTPGHWASDFFAAKLVYRFMSEVFAARR